MITRLEQLTLSQFVNLLCGDYDILLGKHEIGMQDKLMETTRNIVLEYRTIADPGGTQAYFQNIDDMLKARLNIIIFTMCSNLLASGNSSDVREILTVCGVSNARLPDNKIEGIVHSLLAKSKRHLAEIEAENDKTHLEGSIIRSRYDLLTATLMSHFKFQIDPDTIKASIYANLVARYYSEMKAQISTRRI